MLLKPVKTALMLWLHGNDSILIAALFLALTGTPYKYNQCHTTFGVLSSVCAKLESSGSKNNEILEINVLQKFTSHALWAQDGRLLRQKIVIFLRFSSVIMNFFH